MAERAGRLRRAAVLALGVGVVLAAVAVVVWRPHTRPNLILISIDTLRPDHLSTYGYDRDTSPAMTELARDGVRFTAAFVQAPWTIPSHASMLTGRYPCAHGAEAAGFTAPIAGDVPMLAEHLKAAGYQTAGFYEESPFLERQYGFGRGFDVYEGAKRTEASPLGHIVTWLAQQKESRVPFFLFWHKFGVHGPYEPPPYLRGRYAVRQTPRRNPDAAIRFLRGLRSLDYLKLQRYESLPQLVADYDAAIRAVDDQLRVLLSALRGLGLYDDSVIVVTADHGECLFDREIYVGHAIMLYDEHVRVPLIVKPARWVPARPVLDPVVESVDIVPTVMDLLGLEVPRDVDGESLARAIRSGDPRGLDGVAMGVSSHVGSHYLRTARWKYIGPAAGGMARMLYWMKPAPGLPLADRINVREQLYDVLEDPAERVDLIATHPEVAAEMRAQLDAVLARCRSTPAAPRGAVVLTDEERRRLRALGYVQ